MNLSIHANLVTRQTLSFLIFFHSFSSFAIISFPELSTVAKTGKPKTEKPKSTITSSRVIVASPQGKMKVLVSGHHFSAKPRTRSVSLGILYVEAITASKIPAFLQMGSCKDAIFLAQDLNFLFGNLQPQNLILVERAFK
uniref:Uncharacterized protein n=1 Tax=Arabidopsis thaliana TaxID=3702 RepID=I6LEE0_ARATH|nr:hypothetical protein At1g50820 [Arabidopsis thaliana]